MSIPYAFVARPIPFDARRRVWVVGFGFGTEVDRITLGSTVTGIGVRLETGLSVTAAPADVHPAGPADMTNVVPMRRRLEAQL